MEVVLVTLDDLGDKINPDQLKDAQYLISLQEEFCGDAFDFVNYWAGILKFSRNQPIPRNEVQLEAFAKARKLSIKPEVIEIFVKESKERYNELWPEDNIEMLMGDAWHYA